MGGGHVDFWHLREQVFPLHEPLLRIRCRRSKRGSRFSLSKEKNKADHEHGEHERNAQVSEPIGGVRNRRISQTFGYVVPYAKRIPHEVLPDHEDQQETGDEG